MLFSAVEPSRGALAEQLTEPELLDLARCRPGEVGDLVDRLRPLLPGQARRRRCARTSSRVGAAIPVRTRTTAAARSPRRTSGSATTPTSATAVHARQELLDLLGTDVLAAPDDDVGDAVGDGQVAVLVEDADVAGVVPAVGVEGRRRQRRIGVADTTVRSPAEDLAVRLEPDLDPGQGWPSVVRRLTSGSSIRQPVIDGCSVLP